MTPEEKQRIEQIRERHLRVDCYKSQMRTDIDFLLSLVKSQEAGCGFCGGPHDFDTSIPSAVWNAVIRARQLPDYLCVTCIVREFVRAGQGFTATLWNEEFNGVPIEVIINGHTAEGDTSNESGQNN